MQREGNPGKHSPSSVVPIFGHFRFKQRRSEMIEIVLLNIEPVDPIYFMTLLFVARRLKQTK